MFTFRSLQTGKAFRTSEIRNTTPVYREVSIPFKRERLSEPFEMWMGKYTEIMAVQFPSNGKGFPNISGTAKHVLYRLFQFPSNGKGFPNQKSTTLGTTILSLFQFPSNGKGFPNKKVWDYGTKQAVLEFQFSSNGKGFPNITVKTQLQSQ